MPRKGSDQPLALTRCLPHGTPSSRTLRQLAANLQHAWVATMELGGLPVPESALSWKFVRSSGPGGQNVNKVATAAECRLDLKQSCLPTDVLSRLERLAGSRLNAHGEVVVFCDVHRTQARNRAEARQRLDTMVRAAREVPKIRRPTKVPAGQKQQRREEKRRRSLLKQARQTPKDLV